MASVPPDSSGVSEGSKPALGPPNVKGAKLLDLVSRRNSGVPDARYVFADVSWAGGCCYLRGGGGGGQEGNE